MKESTVSSHKIRKIFSVLLGVLILFYIGYQVFASRYSSLGTEVATYATSADVVQSSGIIIRKESVIKKTINGALGYQVENGEKVAKGGVVAKVFSSEKAVLAQNQIESIDKEIQKLSTLSQPGSIYEVSPQLLDSRINQQICTMLNAVRTHDRGKITVSREELLYMLSQRRVADGKTEDYSNRIKQLEGQKAALQSTEGNVSEYIRAPQAGYFTNYVDGYEKTYSYDSAPFLTVDDIKRKLLPQRAEPDIIGKICSQFDWYFVCTVDADAALRMKDISTVRLSMPLATTEKIPATIVAINQKNRDSDAAVILKCNYMNSALADIRKETVQIEIQRYSGVMVNQRAVHFATVNEKVKDKTGKVKTVAHHNVKGVYVKFGKELKFVQIFSDATVNGYVICRTDLTEDDLKHLYTSSTIKLYDEVVTEGKDLYDGKII